MSVIYEPRGKALEYSGLALNLYTGCRHGCTYCYCPSIMRKPLDAWASNPHPRKDILKQLKREAEKMAGDPREVLLCFMCDPYQSDEAATLTRKALLILEQHQMRVQVLTKAGHRATKDFDILTRNGWRFGSTIMCKSEATRKTWEPGAPSIQSRYDAVKQAHNLGIKTWVSVEPVVDPVEALAVIGDLLPVVDHWKIGKLNHNREVEASVDWAKFLADVEQALDGKSYYIKKDLEAQRNKVWAPVGEHQ